MRVVEVYKAIQGEGPNAGRPCVFLRTGLCNLDCVWCDTPYTWDVTRYDVEAEAPEVTMPRLIEKFNAIDVDGTGRLVLTGGEPMMWRSDETMRDLFHWWSGPVDVETNGTLVPSMGLVEAVDTWVVSPKLASSGVRESKRFKPRALDVFSGFDNAVFKFVITSEADLGEVLIFQRTLGLPADRIWLMAEGITQGDQLAGMRSIEGLCIEHGFNMSPRLHVLTHGNKRGV